MAQNTLNQITSHARAGIHRGQDEQRLEHDGEVIPEVESAAIDGLGKNLRHADGQRRRAAGAAEQGFFAKLVRQ